MRPYVFVYARSDSERLPAKVLMTLAGRTLIDTVLDRAARVGARNRILLTSTRSVDDVLSRHVESQGIPVIRGHATDLVHRTLSALVETGATHFLRVNGDSPLFAPELARYALPLIADADMVSNLIVRRFPYGVSVEWVAANTYVKLADDAQPSEREHVTQHLYRHLRTLKHVSLEQQRDDSGLKLTLDTLDDHRRLDALFAGKDPSATSYWQLHDMPPPQPEAHAGRLNTP